MKISGAEDPHKAQFSQGVGRKDTWLWIYCCCSLTKLCSTLHRAHGVQHTRLLCPPLSPRVCSNSCPLSQWCYLTISSSFTPFSFCLQSFPATGSFSRSWLFASGGPSTGASLGLTALISLLSKGLSRVFQHHNAKASVLQRWSLYGPTLTSIHDHWNSCSFDYMYFGNKSMSLLFNMLSRFVILSLKAVIVF